MENIINEIKKNGFNVFNNNIICFKGLKQLNKIVNIIYSNDINTDYNILFDINTDMYFQGQIKLYKVKNHY